MIASIAARFAAALAVVAVVAMGGSVANAATGDPVSTVTPPPVAPHSNPWE